VTKIPLGYNNREWDTPEYSIEGITYTTARFTLKDAKVNRYEIPQDVLSVPDIDPTMRTEMYGLQATHTPMEWSFTDVRDPDLFYVKHTKN